MDNTSFNMHATSSPRLPVESLTAWSCRSSLDNGQETVRAERFGGNEYYERISSHEALEEMEEAEAAERELEEVCLLSTHMS